MKAEEPVSRHAVARYRRLHTYTKSYFHMISFQYKFNYQWVWRTKTIDTGIDCYRKLPSNDELEKIVIDWLDLRARSGSL